MLLTTTALAPIPACDPIWISPGPLAPAPRSRWPPTHRWCPGTIAGFGGNWLEYRTIYANPGVRIDGDSVRVRDRNPAPIRQFSGISAPVATPPETKTENNQLAEGCRDRPGKPQRTGIALGLN